jgi:hypothetical protein
MSIFNKKKIKGSKGNRNHIGRDVDDGDRAHRGTVRSAAPAFFRRRRRRRRINNEPNAYDSLLARTAGVCEHRRPGVRRPRGVTLEGSTPA